MYTCTYDIVCMYVRTYVCMYVCIVYVSVTLRNAAHLRKFKQMHAIHAISLRYSTGRFKVQSCIAHLKPAKGETLASDVLSLLISSVR